MKPRANADAKVIPPSRRPRQMGFTMPAEYTTHEATWLAWPHNKDDWPGKFAPIPWVFAEVVRLVSRRERVEILVQNSAAQRQVRRILERVAVDFSNVRFHQQATDRVWLRDSGAIFLQRPMDPQSGSKKLETAASVFRFNGWAKYDNHAADGEIAPWMASRVNRSWNVWAPRAGAAARPFVLEGGSIDVNGDGCVLTTEECLLSKVQQRNPGLNKAAIETILRDFLGVEKVLWLDRGIAGDDTHGHVDDTARFVNRTTIAACVERDAADANYEPLAENLRRLKKMRNSHGEPFDIVELPLPAPVIFDGQRLPASYANFYAANVGILVPVFNDRKDALALTALQECFPNRPIIPVYCRDLVWGLGALHCMTQQQPAPVVVHYPV